MPTEYHLHEGFFVNPLRATATITLKQLKGLMLRTDGHFIACGHLWNIKPARLCPGVYRITAERMYPDKA